MRDGETAAVSEPGGPPRDPTGLAGWLDRKEGAVRKAIGRPEIPSPKPHPAATMIIVDAETSPPRVLLGRRHDSHVFMPGKFVFPGGRVEPADRTMAIAGALPAPVESRLAGLHRTGSVGYARALALAAIRETFEETGLVIGRTDFGAPEDAPAGVWGEFGSTGAYPTLEPLHFIARAVTPPGRPRRFDVAFFAVDSSEIVLRMDGRVGPTTELVELVWLPIEQTEKIDLPNITRVVLVELEHRLASGMGHHMPVPYFHQRHGRWRRDEL